MFMSEKYWVNKYYHKEETVKDIKKIDNTDISRIGNKDSENTNISHTLYV